MIKKFLRTLKILTVGVLWSYIFVVLARFLMLKLWNFDLLNPQDWDTIARYWDNGGSIKIAKDYIFSINIILLPFLWIYGWKKLDQTNFLNLLLWPLNLYNHWRYNQEMPRIILKKSKNSYDNLAATKQKLDSIKPQKPTEVKTIREEIQKKIESQTSKY